MIIVLQESICSICFNLVSGRFDLIEEGFYALIICTGFYSFLENLISIAV